MDLVRSGTEWNALGACNFSKTRHHLSRSLTLRHAEITSFITSAGRVRGFALTVGPTVRSVWDTLNKAIAIANQIKWLLSSSAQVKGSLVRIDLNFMTKLPAECHSQR